MSKYELSVADLMTPRPETVAPCETLATAQRKMNDGRFRALPVVQMGRLVGILSDRDLLPFIGRQGEIPVKEAMTKAIVTVTPATHLHEAAQLLIRHKIDALPVVNEGQPVGVVTSSDILVAYVRLIGELRKANRQAARPGSDWE
jgi:CBS domain-containing protein